MREDRVVFLILKATGALASPAPNAYQDCRGWSTDESVGFAAPLGRSLAVPAGAAEAIETHLQHMFPGKDIERGFDNSGERKWTSIQLRGKRVAYRSVADRPYVSVSSVGWHLLGTASYG